MLWMTPSFYIEHMLSLAEASLSPQERVLLERFAQELRARLGDGVHDIWLFGSRARGEQPGEDSDVDILVLVQDASWEARMWVRGLLDVAARELGMETVGWRFSIHVHTPVWLAQRRAIEAFFIAEVDRDKIAM
ncbi:MAG TPA: nucleotidyltransferase domain-containing protein [Solirubrobacteraceae bacterium]|jgi:predicted nucleotidyltransferase|nr:nucleotidyltransferase domain-containing protein [Solirubrobacteraceae bacterium]